MALLDQTINETSFVSGTKSYAHWTTSSATITPFNGFLSNIIPEWLSDEDEMRLRNRKEHHPWLIFTKFPSSFGLKEQGKAMPKSNEALIPYKNAKKRNGWISFLYCINIKVTMLRFYTMKQRKKNRGKKKVEYILSPQHLTCFTIWSSTFKIQHFTFNYKSFTKL